MSGESHMKFSDLSIDDFIMLRRKYIEKNTTIINLRNTANTVKEELNLDSYECAFAALMVAMSFVQHDDAIRSMYLVIDNRQNELYRLKNITTDPQTTN